MLFPSDRSVKREIREGFKYVEHADEWEKTILQTQGQKRTYYTQDQAMQVLRRLPRVAPAAGLGVPYKRYLRRGAWRVVSGALLRRQPFLGAAGARGGASPIDTTVGWGAGARAARSVPSPRALCSVQQTGVIGRSVRRAPPFASFIVSVWRFSPSIVPRAVWRIDDDLVSSAVVTKERGCWLHRWSRCSSPVEPLCPRYTRACRPLPLPNDTPSQYCWSAAKLRQDAPSRLSAEPNRPRSGQRVLPARGRI